MVRQAVSLCLRVGRLHAQNSPKQKQQPSTMNWTQLQSLEHNILSNHFLSLCVLFGLVLVLQWTVSSMGAETTRICSPHG